jgi:2'-5' RNA ligase
MVEDLTFEAYRRELARKGAEAVGGFLRGPAGKFRPRPEGGAPLPYPGCTVLAKPYPLGEPVRAALEQWQNTLAGKSGAIVPVPTETLHVTLADLVAGPAYRQVGRQGVTQALERRVRAILAGHRLEPPLEAVISGVGAFRRSVVAFVDLEAPAAYRSITSLRAALYEDPQLAAWGVTSGPFLGHVTLGYLESEASTGIEDALRQIRQAPAYLRFPIDGAGLFRFADLSAYTEAD